MLCMRHLILQVLPAEQAFTGHEENVYFIEFKVAIYEWLDTLAFD